MWNYSKKTSHDASDARYEALSVGPQMTVNDFARASVEVGWVEEPTPERYINIMDFSPLGQINTSKTKR